MKPYVVFLNKKQPKSNTTNIHRTTCGHYKKYLKKDSTNTEWYETKNLPPALGLAMYLYKKYSTLGVRHMKCCMKEYSNYRILC